VEHLRAWATVLFLHTSSCMRFAITTAQHHTGGLIDGVLKGQWWALGMPTGPRNKKNSNMHVVGESVLWSLLIAYTDHNVATLEQHEDRNAVRPGSTMHRASVRDRTRRVALLSHADPSYVLDFY
jgi:hypothetical protein